MILLHKHLLVQLLSERQSRESEVFFTFRIRRILKFVMICCKRSEKTQSEFRLGVPPRGWNQVRIPLVSLVTCIASRKFETTSCEQIL